MPNTTAIPALSTRNCGISRSIQRRASRREAITSCLFGGPTNVERPSMAPILGAPRLMESQADSVNGPLDRHVGRGSSRAFVGSRCKFRADDSRGFEHEKFLYFSALKELPRIGRIVARHHNPVRPRMCGLPRPACNGTIASTIRLLPYIQCRIPLPHVMENPYGAQRDFAGFAKRRGGPEKAFNRRSARRLDRCLPQGAH